MRDGTLGVYLHVPFCERVCPYCDFPVVAARPLAPEREARYVAALLAELEARRGALAGRRLASVYLGGGTPSLLRPESVARLLAAVRGAFAPEAAGPAPEVTLEVNPSTVERGRLPGFRAAGVTRLSVGVQSFDDTTLRRLGRAHRAEEARATLAAARAAGFSNLSLDLLFAAPGQTREGLRRDVEALLAQAPEHVSAYALTLEEGTPFARAAAEGRLELPDDDAVAEMLELVAGALQAAGLRPYELSSYARPGYESVHNRRYWERRPVLGLGVGAWSTLPAADGAPFGARRSNRRDVEGYVEDALAGRSVAAGPTEVLDARTARGEAVFLALRTARGLDARAFAEEFGSGPRALYGSAIEELVRGGLLEEDDAGDLRLTHRGRLLSDGVFERFV